ncbi:MAG: ABC-F family ATP-binding cassette domain-containing protein [Thermoflexaceae bacterium]|nr:ABC-F family ATP-binding cassette domain-containing protein [Thermoflexaceae bacterium]
MILSCNNICKSFDGVDILKHVSFHVEEHEKAAIVGINGAGKSTLLKIIMNELSAEEGLVTFAKDKTVGYLAQHQNVDSENTIYTELLSVKEHIIEMEKRLRQLEEQMSVADDSELEGLMNSYSSLNHQFEQADGYAYKSEVTGILKGLGFEEADFSRKIQTLSGGQKTRVALGKLLLTKPDLILLDEPTNHLDLDSIRWLETFLLNYNGAVLIVAHDRYFLDRIVSKIIELDNGECTVFTGNYTAYASKKAILRKARLNEYLKQQQEIRHQEAVIEKLKQFNREKSIRRAESREKMLDRMERIDKPAELNASMNLVLEPGIISGNDVLSVTDLSKSFDGTTLFSNIHFEIKRGEKVALIGGNGTGKTTILKLINGILTPDSGSIRLGTNVTIGYYDQEHHVLNPDKTLFEEIQDAYPDMNNTKIRNTLAAFLFTGDDVFKKISDLSGGEKGRVSLAKLMLSNANLLILDEPTNHLDMISREILENALNSYTGTIFYVSHDRYFINSTATRILELKGNILTNFDGNYDYYIEKYDILGVKDTPVSSDTANTSLGKANWKAGKEEQAALRKQKNELKRVEASIEELEQELNIINEQVNAPENATNPAKLLELHKKQVECENLLSDLYEKWEILAE